MAVQHRMATVDTTVGGSHRHAVHQVMRRDSRERRERRAAPRSLWAFVRDGDFPTLLTMPLIYSVAIPFVILDAWVAIYQAVCFRAWGIRPVPRDAYVVVDRHRLTYLNALEKLNCLYCSYANGVIARVREVAARTEQYWCPIKHGRQVRGLHDRYLRFAEYGDAAAYSRRLRRLRRQLGQENLGRSNRKEKP